MMHVSTAMSQDGIQPSITPSVGNLEMEPGAAVDSLASSAYPIPDASSTLASMNTTAKKRKATKSKGGKAPPRSVDTPANRRPVMGDVAIDKKRNKLGYQRISIACAHCRRRKIRCLVAAGDPNARCQNCIRLKKECLFYPVDQQTAMENKSPSIGKTGVRTGPSSAAGTPPDPGSGTLFDERRGVASFPTLPSNVPDGYPEVSLEAGVPSTTQGTMVPPQFAFPQHPGSRSPWIGPTGFATAGPTIVGSPTGLADPQYARFNQQPSGDFTPFPATLSASPMSTNDQAFAVAQQRADQMWSHPPVRAMSNGPLEGFAQPFDPYSGGFPAGSILTSSDRQAAASMDMQIPTAIMQTPESRSVSMPLPLSTFMDQPQLYALRTDAPQSNLISMSPLPAFSGPWIPSQFVQLQDQNFGGPNDFIVRPTQPG